MESAGWSGRAVTVPATRQDKQGGTPLSFGNRFRKAAIAMGATVALGGGLLAGLGPGLGQASSHREAPLLAADPQVDGTDLYAFRSPDRPGAITFVSNWLPFEEPAGGPNFFAWADGVNYDIKIDNDGDARADIIYRWVFRSRYRNPDSFLYNNGPVTSLRDRNLNYRQTYDLYRIKNGRSRLLVDNAKAAPSDVGKASMPDYGALEQQAIVTFGNEDQPSRTLAGQADDPFFLDLRVFDLAYGCQPPYPGCAPGTAFSEAGDDTLTGFNVNTLVLQVPRGAVAGPSRPIIGVWTTAQRRSTRVQSGATGSIDSTGKFVQVSRLGMPLVNEVVVPVGAKDYFNASKPKNDGQFLGKVEDPELPHVIHALYGLDVPDSDPDQPGIQRDDLVQVFLTGFPGLNKPEGVQPSEMLRLNMRTPLCGTGGAPACSPFGVLGNDPQGFPNGRRLADDIIDVSLRVVEGHLLGQNEPTSSVLGDGVDVNDVSFRSSFPYVALPHRGSDANPH
jgi:Domain of unknown function (DUF4331)